MEIHPNAIVVAVMGLTGVGKSTFIKTVTGRDDIPIGHSLSSGNIANSFLHRMFSDLGRRNIRSERLQIPI
jgi:ABC-type proline/glycine betaine transport system ATPase subunit